MIIVKEKNSQKEGITNYDKTILASASSKVMDVLYDQYTRNLKTAGTMLDINHFAYAQVCGALTGIIGSLGIIDADTPTVTVKRLIDSLRKMKNTVEKGLSN
jgi:hypothetical protein